MAFKQNLAHLNLKSVKLLWKQGCDIVTNNQRLSDKKLELIKSQVMLYIIAVLTNGIFS